MNEALELGYSHLVAVLGAEYDQPPLQELLSRLGAEPQLKRMEQLAFLEYPGKGIAFAFKDKLFLTSRGREYSKDGPLVLIGIHLYHRGHEGYGTYGGELIDRVSFEDDRSAIHRKLGGPAVSGGGNRAVGRLWPFWDRYDLTDHSVRFQYGEDGNRLTVITLIAPVEVRTN